MARFVHVRHREPVVLERARELVVACPPLQSHVNLSRIIRMAGSCGVTRVIACGNASLHRSIARDGADTVELEIRRTLAPPLNALKSEGYLLVGLEQTTPSESLFEFHFARRTALVLGHERHGITEEILDLLDHVVEIPIFGRPHAYNVATAATIALYEYCRQFPAG